MKFFLALAPFVVVVATAIVAGWYGVKDANSMYPRSKKPVDAVRRKGLVAELAALDQQIADLERLTISKSDDATLKRATDLLAEARIIRQDVEWKLRAGNNGS